MRAIFEMDYAGEFCATTAEVSFGGGDDYSTASFDAAEQLWVDLAAPLSQDCNLTVIRLDSNARTSAAQGSNTDPALPGNCALRYLKKNSGRDGSMNLPGILELQVGQNGLIPAATLAVFRGIASAALAAYEASGGQMFVYGAPLGAGVRTVSDLDVSARIGTFRNRMYGR